jgi:hypothetical protein
MSKTLKTRLKLKYDTSANWADSTLVLLAGEAAVEVVTKTTGDGDNAVTTTYNKIKFGNGTDVFKDLPYANYTPDEITELINANVTYTNEDEMPAAVGGLKAGTSFDNMTIQEILNKLLYPYTKPTLTNSGITITFSDGSTTTTAKNQEYGVTITQIDYKTTPVKKSNSLASLVFTPNDGGDGSTVTSPESSKAYTHTYKPSTPLNETTSATITLKDAVENGDGGQSTTSSIKITYYRPIYVGYLDCSATDDIMSATTDADKVAIIETEIENEHLSKLIQDTTGTISKTASFTLGRYCFASTKKLGHIYDGNNFDNTDSFDCLTLSLTGKDGAKTPYYVYVFSSVIKDSVDFLYKYSYT